jgi:protein phosphatase
MGTLSEQSAFNLSTLRCAAGTDVGMRRDENQDCFGIFKSDLYHGYFIADGMGGVHGGATASRLAISTLEELLPKGGGRVGPDHLISIASQANGRIFDRGSQEPSLAGMGTTLVGLVFTPEGLISVNVGDSRAYRVRGNSIQQLTEDHTLVRELVRSGALDLAEAEKHPVSHMLTRSLGPVAEVQIEARFVAEAPELGDIYILCSDGLYNLVSEEEILGVVRQNPLDDANQILINLANQRGGPDNITVLVISVGERIGKGRSQEYRTARGSAAYISQDEAHTDLEESHSDVEERKRHEGASEDAPPPPVAEPKDPREQRRKILAERVQPVQQNRGLPVPLLVIAALVLGLTAGDLARRFGVNLGSFTFESGSESGGSQGSAQSLSELSQHLEIQRAPAKKSGAALPEIAKQLDVRSDRADGETGEAEGLSSSRLVLQRAVANLEQQLALLSAPAGEQNAADLAAAKARLTELRKDNEELQLKVATTSHTVAQWTARRVKLDEPDVDIFKSANQLKAAGASPASTQAKLEKIVELSNSFQETESNLEVNPDDEKLKRSLAEKREQLIRLRAELLIELRSLHDQVLFKVNTENENAKMQRDSVSAQKQAAENEVVLRETLASADPVKRVELKTSLERQLADMKATLAALENRGR